MIDIKSSNIFATPYYFMVLLFETIDKNEMGGACSSVGERERCVQGFGGET
jgi:hypothetical protein